MSHLKERDTKVLPAAGVSRFCSAHLHRQPSQSGTRLYVGLEAIHVDSAVFFALLQVPRGNWRLLPFCLRSDTLLQLHEPGNLGGDELVFNSR